MSDLKDKLQILDHDKKNTGIYISSKPTYRNKSIVIFKENSGYSDKCTLF